MNAGDKKHLFYSIALTVAITILQLFFWRSYWILAISGIVALAGGIAYEYLQRYLGGNFEKRDILFDFVGVWFGIGISSVIISIIN